MSNTNLSRADPGYFLEWSDFPYPPSLRIEVVKHKLYVLSGAALQDAQHRISLVSEPRVRR
jgi:hypothetical protein